MKLSAILTHLSALLVHGGDVNVQELVFKDGYLPSLKMQPKGEMQYIKVTTTVKPSELPQEVPGGS